MFVYDFGMINDRAWAWIVANWFFAGALAAAFLFALVPILAGTWSLALLSVYLLLPIYMIHQVEEHYDDRFRTFANKLIGGGRDVLTHLAVVVINVVGVWIVFLLTLYAAAFGGAGFGLIATYTMLVNALLHIGPAIKLRGYNPGLVTAIVLFLPFGFLALIAISRTPGVTVTDHVMGIIAAIVIHGAIMVHVKRRAATL